MARARRGVVAVLVAGWLVFPGAAVAGSDDESRLPAISGGLGVAAGNWCKTDTCSFDPAALLMHVGAYPRDGFGGYAGMLGTLSVRDACIEWQCGDMALLATLTAGVAYRGEWLRAHVATGIGGSPGASAFLPADAMLGIRLYRGGDTTLDLRAHYTQSLAPTRDRYVAGVSLGFFATP